MKQTSKQPSSQKQVKSTPGSPDRPLQTDIKQIEKQLKEVDPTELNQESQKLENEI